MPISQSSRPSAKRATARSIRRSLPAARSSADVERQITAEINRIVTSAKTEHEMAKSREESLEASLDELKNKAAGHSIRPPSG